MICGQGCAGVSSTGVARLCLYIRAAKVDATKKRSILKQRIKLSGGFILLSGESLQGEKCGTDTLVCARFLQIPHSTGKSACATKSLPGLFCLVYGLAADHGAQDMSL